MKVKWIWMTVIFFSIGAGAVAEENDGASPWQQLFSSVDVHGFTELRGGYRIRKDPYQKDMSVMEARTQLDLSSYNDWGDFKYKGDIWGDLVAEQGDYETRELWFFTRPADWMDFKLGRQVLTWGTGDLLFLNDLFPKDWQSFFIGRDSEYLKAPSDAAKFSFFTDAANIDVVYTPKFDSDRYITGQYLSYWNNSLSRRAGRDAYVYTDKPDRCFRDDEIALRIYKNINNYEYALYGYWGFWKSPAGMTPTGSATFPDLNVYGASVRGQVAKGIGNAEIAYYESADDQNGKNPLISNSELRYLVGYTQEIAKDVTGGLQYYLEQMLDYNAYLRHLSGGPKRDRDRHVLTARLTKLLMNQNLSLSMFTYYSPSDSDVYLRPNIHYKATDTLSVETGANIFFGDHPHTFFSQFENNSNIYAAVRYSF
ncbi:MAG: hypothetical protein KBI46_05370 [Phycisphaerae bacterium]|nr:hypothetical protein [Phycisphaerae bacterium]